MTQGSIWLASWPRSGNTLLRTVLHQCFGLVSGSVYPNDLGENAALGTFVGHVEHAPDGGIDFPAGAPHLIKTHEPPRGDTPAIYIVRDGRPACVSLWRFLGVRRFSLEEIIAGDHRFGTWASHLESWHPWDRQGTLFLRYEDILSDLPATLDRLSTFLDAEIIARTLPDRDSIVSVDGKWVRRQSDWRAAMSGDLLTLFEETNGDMMRKLGYGTA